MKKVLIFFITIINFILICLLCGSFVIKQTCVEIVKSNIVRKEISSYTLDVINKEYPEIDNEVLEQIEVEVQNNPSVGIIADKYVNNLLESITNDSQIKAPDIKEEINNLIVQNQKTLEENGIYLTEEEKDEFIQKITNNNRLEKTYVNVANKVKSNLSEPEIKVIKAYDVVISNNFKIIIFVSILIFTLIIALLKKSFYKWIPSLCFSFFLSGMVIVFLLPLLVNGIEKYLSNNLLGRTTEININLLVNSGYVCLSISALLLITYFVINKLVIHNEQNYEV